MSIFSTILQKIFPSNHPAVTAPSTPTSTTTAPAGSAPTTAPGSAGTAAAQALPAVDVEAILTEKASKSGPLWFADVEYEYRNADSGELALREITRIIERG